MKRYLYDKMFVLSGDIEVGEFDTFPRRSTLVEPPALGVGEFAVFNGIDWAIVVERPVAPVRVPQVVTMAQARLALLASGRLADVAAALDALPEPPKTSALIEWEFRDTVHRNRDLVLTILDGTLGMTNTEIDDLFILAASL